MTDLRGPVEAVGLLVGLVDDAVDALGGRVLHVVDSQGRPWTITCHKQSMTQTLMCLSL